MIKPRTRVKLETYTETNMSNINVSNMYLCAECISSVIRSIISTLTYL